jgi:hypothetical protein
MNETETDRFPGWWLPDPRPGRTDARVRRMKMFAAWFLRLLVIGDACLFGLLATEANLSVGGAVCVAVIVGALSAMIVFLIIALMWSEAP